MHASENELRIKSHLSLVNTEIQSILEYVEKGLTHDLKKFNQLVHTLEGINDVTDAPRINEAVRVLIRLCKSNTSTQYNWQELSTLTQKLLNYIQF